MQVWTRAGLPERALNQSNRIDPVDSEAVPLTNCEAMYQAAVSKQADTFPSGVLHCVHGHALFPAAWCSYGQSCLLWKYYMCFCFILFFWNNRRWLSTLNLVCLNSLCTLWSLCRASEVTQKVDWLLLLVPSCSIFHWGGSQQVAAWYMCVHEAMRNLRLPAQGGPRTIQGPILLPSSCLFLSSWTPESPSPK